MTYRISDTKVTLVCNGCGTTMEESTENVRNLIATQRVWSRASAKGWTSTSTAHHCKRCTP